MEDTEDKYSTSWDEQVRIYKTLHAKHRKLSRILSLIQSMRAKGLDKILFASGSLSSFGLCRYIGYDPEKPHVWFQFDNISVHDDIGDGMVVHFRKNFESHFLDNIYLRYEDISLTPEIENLLKRLLGESGD